MSVLRCELATRRDIWIANRNTARWTGRKNAAMPNPNYVAGRRFEYRVRDRLKESGARLVVRAAQSKGPVDLVAFWSPRTAPWLVQAKTGSARMTKAETEELVHVATTTGSIAYLAEPGPGGKGVSFTCLM